MMAKAVSPLPAATAASASLLTPYSASGGWATSPSS